MKPLGSETLELLWQDADRREARIREIVTERMAEPPPTLDDQLVATYFFALRTLRLEQAADEIAYHATSGTRNPPPGSLLEECTAKAVGVDAWDATGRIGLLHVAFPLKMLLRQNGSRVSGFGDRAQTRDPIPDTQYPDSLRGSLTSTDMLHTLAGAIIFDVYENQDAKLVAIQIPGRVIRTFPGPAYGPHGLRQLTSFPPGQPAFGTILKPTAGITPDEVGRLVEEAARCPLFLFVKEDENLYPNLDYSPVTERVRRAIEGIERAKDERGGTGIIFAPHIGGAPHEILETVHAVLDAGATGVMFSETYAGGTVRMVREATRGLSRPPAIYGHNAGIGTRTHHIYREVTDMLARLDGIDFRQTAPVKPGTPFLLPYGQEWVASEIALCRPLPGIKPTMIVRAGGLDQGNICMNLADAEERGLMEGVLFLAGSAINSVKNAAGTPDPRLGAEAMTQALEVHRSGALRDVPIDEQVHTIKAIAEQNRLPALGEALRQRYPMQ